MIEKYLITKAHAIEGFDVDLCVIPITEEQVRKIRRLMDRLPTLFVEEVGIEGLTLNSLATFYARNVEVDEDGVVDDFLWSMDACEWTLVDTLPEWLDDLTTVVYTSPDHVEIFEHMVTWVAYDKYSNEKMESESFMPDDLDALLLTFRANQGEPTDA